MKTWISQAINTCCGAIYFGHRTQRGPDRRIVLCGREHKYTQLDALQDGDRNSVRLRIALLSRDRSWSSDTRWKNGESGTRHEEEPRHSFRIHRHGFPQFSTSSTRLHKPNGNGEQCYVIISQEIRRRQSIQQRDPASHSNTPTRRLRRRSQSGKK